MTREEAIDILVGVIVANSDEEAEALDVAIEALERERTDEWCDDCKEYDTEKKCCPRFNKVIREAMKRVPHEDGTLEVKVEDATKVRRVLIADDKHRGGLYYPDEDEGDLISRAEAIAAVTKYANEHTFNSYFRGMLKAVSIIADIPSADRPRGEWIETAQDYYEMVNKKGGGVNENTEYFTDDIACPNCLAKFSNIDNETERFDFCPNCGADMRGDAK